MSYFAHESAYVDDGCTIGDGTKIWHFCHVQKGARIGRNCVLGQNVNVANDVEIGDGVKVQNNVSIYTGTVIEDYVFLGPSCVLTNVTNPRSEVNRHSLYEKTVTTSDKGKPMGTIESRLVDSGTGATTAIKGPVKPVEMPKMPWGS